MAQRAWGPGRSPETNSEQPGRDGIIGAAIRLDRVVEDQVASDLPGLALLIGAGVLIAAGVLLLRHFRCAWIVQVRGGVPRITRGTVSQAFLSDCRELCRIHGIDRATIRGVMVEQRMELRFSRSIPADVRQSFRNVWGLR